MIAFHTSDGVECKERAAERKKLAITTFDWKIHELGSNCREEGLNTGETRDGEKNVTVAEGDKEGYLWL
ncbi:MAG: hypothetical protein U0223_07855 [Nitrospira sp.]|nr:hypothetical protein [Nitrospira sp.]